MPIDLNDPEVKDAIAAAVEQATQGLVTKNADLLRDLRKAKSGATVDPAEVQKLEDENATLKTQVTELTRAKTKAEGLAERATKDLQAEQSQTQRLLVDTGLNDALAKAGVTNPGYLKAVKSMLAMQAKVEVEGDARVVKIDGKALPDYVKEWSTSDDGKHFVAAPGNSGGGSGGGGGNTAKAFKDLSETERTELYRRDPAEFQRQSTAAKQAA